MHLDHFACANQWVLLPGLNRMSTQSHGCVGFGAISERVLGVLQQTYAECIARHHALPPGTAYENASSINSFRCDAA